MEIYNKQTKRYNSVKSAVKNGLLRNPNNFSMPSDKVLVKTKRGYELKTPNKAKKFIGNQNDYLSNINKNFLYNPSTGNIVINNKRNRDNIEKLKKKYYKLESFDFSYYPYNLDLYSWIRKIIKNNEGKNIEIQLINYDTGFKSTETYTIPKNSNQFIKNDIHFKYFYEGTGLLELNFNEGENGTISVKIFNDVEPKNKKQAFKDGVSNCLLTPIKNWALEKYENGSKPTKRKYKQKLEYIDECLKKYKNGVPEDDIFEISNKLQIDININLPFGVKNEALRAKSHKKPLEKFNYINSRLDHVENYNINTGNIKVIDIEEMEYIKEWLEKNDIYHIFKRDYKYHLSSISTNEATYILKNKRNEIINNFEIETGLSHAGIDEIKNTDLIEFIRSSVHYNGTTDFKQTRIPDEDNEEEHTLLDWRKFIHIDMEKAYYNFDKCFLYEGFLYKITDFRETDKIEAIGIYKINNLDFSKADEKFIKYNERMNIYRNNYSYPSPELKLLKKYGVKFNILGGCWGSKIDFRFNDEMKTKIDDTPLYSLYAGLCDSHRLIKQYRVNGNIEYSELLSNYAQKGCSVNYDEGRNEVVINYPVKKNICKSHITAFLTSYQRISTLEQLMALKYENIVRVCVDGIYHSQKDYELKNVFRTDKKGTFNNPETGYYISNKKYEKSFNSKRDFYLKELHLGEGGCGKTYSNLVDKGLVNACFIAPSWKLAKNKEEEFNIDCSVWARLVNKDVSYINYFKENYNVLIIDEVSMMTNGEKEFIFNTYSSLKLIFCGDIGYQLPCWEGNPIDKKGFEIIKNDYGNSRRCKCEKLREILTELRKLIENDEDVYYINTFVINYFKKLNKYEDIKKIDYKIEDMILVGTQKERDEISKKYEGKFNELEKYYITENSREYQNGMIIISSEKPKTKCIIRHAFTTHSIQGETAQNNLYIVAKKMFEPQMFYTALSRAKTIDQIKILY